MEGLIEVVGVIDSDSGVVDKVLSWSLDLVLVDSQNPQTLEIAKKLHTYAPHMHLVGIGVPRSVSGLSDCLRAGVTAYVEQDASLAELVAVIPRIARGDFVCSPSVNRLLLGVLSTQLPKHEALGNVAALTHRERHIAELLTEGLTNKEIASTLSIELGTVKTHVHNVLRKLHIHNRREAASLIVTLSDDGEDGKGLHPSD